MTHDLARRGLLQRPAPGAPAAIGADPANRRGPCRYVPSVPAAGAPPFPRNFSVDPTGAVGATARWIADAVERDCLRRPGASMV